MKILIVCSKNSGSIAPFITEQVDSMKVFNIQFEYFCIHGKGVKGYLSNYNLFLRKIKEYKPDLIHAHYGFSALFSVLQIKTKVISTFHGSDLIGFYKLLISNIAGLFSKEVIVVNDNMKKKFLLKNTLVIPCGVDLNLFLPKPKRQYKHQKKIKVLFSSSFSNKVKNFPLAKQVCDKFTNIELIELSGLNRKQVANLFHQIDIALLTSHSEGSPQFIKEAMATNTIIVSVNVGDVQSLISNVEGTFISSHHPDELIDAIQKAILYLYQTNVSLGRNKLLKLGISNENIAKKIIDVYRQNI